MLVHRKPRRHRCSGSCIMTASCSWSVLSEWLQDVCCWMMYLYCVFCEAQWLMLLLCYWPNSSLLQVLSGWQDLHLRASAGAIFWDGTRLFTCLPVLMSAWKQVWVIQGWSMAFKNGHNGTSQSSCRLLSWFEKLKLESLKNPWEQMGWCSDARQCLYWQVACWL